MFIVHLLPVLGVALRSSVFGSLSLRTVVRLLPLTTVSTLTQVITTHVLNRIVIALDCDELASTDEYSLDIERKK